MMDIILNYTFMEHDTNIVHSRLLSLVTCSHQTPTIYCTSLAIIMTIAGFGNDICSTITFKNNELREVGCSVYS
jgi:hypothetical protein